MKSVPNYTTIEAKMQADYDAIGEAFQDSRHNMHWPELDAMIAQVKPGSRVLDVGCGTGRLGKQLVTRQVEYSGVDLSAKMLAEAKKLVPGGNFMQAAMTKLPFVDQSFDVVFMVASLHHLFTANQRELALAEAKRVLKNGGILNLTVKAFWQKKYWPLFFNKKTALANLAPAVRNTIKRRDIFWPWRWHLKPGQIIYRYYYAFRRGELKKLLHQAGFAVIKIEYVNNGRRVPFYRAKNLVAVARKRV